MARKNTKLIREQLDITLNLFNAVKSLSPPPKGWIRAVRDALGMNGRQFANRLGMHPSRVTVIERDEVAGALTLKTMQKAAEALDCVLVYGVVPRTSLEDIVRKQVARVAKEKLIRSSHTMALEDQELAENEQKKVFDELEAELLRKMPKLVWDEA